MTSTIDPLLDIQTKVLRATFVNNMAVLKKYMPEVFEFYQNYSPTRVKLTFDANGFLNLVSNGNLIYQDDPKSASEQQVTEFLKKPRHLTYHVHRDGNKTYEHELVLEKMIERRISEVGLNNTAPFSKGDQIDFIAFMGTGLGYHLQRLFSQNDIRYAFVYEPDPDCFFCTLHSVDIGDMIKSCFSKGGQLTLQIGGNANGFVNEIAKIFKRRGYFNASRLFLYRHYLSDETKNAFQMVHDLAHRYVSGWGFCEDEIIGISHTLSNITESQFPCLLTSAKESKREQPVFIIGNGPSLDGSIDYLKQHADKAIVFSCGTALKTLLNHGITPDIHIEMERPAILLDLVLKMGNKEQFKKIDLICLNTVYPEVLKLFKKAHLMLKPLDAGGVFVKEFISDKFTEVMYCNPTVSNAAASVAVEMGFENLVLFGVDYGFKDETHHHSKESIYYKDNEDLKFKLPTMKGSLRVPGNFVEEVSTTQIFDGSRMMLEMLLQANPDINCTNTSDGAKIQLSTPCQLYDLPAFSVIKDKGGLTESILSECFGSREYLKKDLNKEFESLLPKFSTYINKLKLFLRGVTTRVELAEAFSNQYAFINTEENNRSKALFQRFVNGSLNYMQSNIMSNVYLYTEREQQEQYIQFCLEILTNHFDWLFIELSENYNKPAKF
ncbi:MAG: motility associated factor glycosyltransferase family protein [Psychromonas sp.]|nr:motility associated factor glycosyltransferase family protein [Alteromonadales bacterium]MCP5077654.1 motility associated factor glycosyltransferase family protein [Psychromonas sp.]